MSIASPVQLEAWLNQALFAQRSAVAAELENHHQHLTASVMQMLHGKEWAVQPPEAEPLPAALAAPPTQTLPQVQKCSDRAAVNPAPPPSTELQAQTGVSSGDPESKEEPVKPKMSLAVAEGLLGELQLNKPPRTAREAVHHPAFELFFISLICLNAIIMALATQYAGIQLGFEMQYPGSVSDSEATWPHADGLFRGLSSFFGAAFTLELLVKIVALRWHFVRSAWNWLDFFVVLVWIMDASGGATLETFANPTILRLARLARLLRLVEVVQFGTSFQSLAILVTSIKGCGPILGWSMLLLCTIMIIGAMIMHYMLSAYMDDEANLDRIEVYKYFGTFTRSMLSMFEVTLGNWIPVTRMLVENVSEFYSIFFVLYKVFVGFAITKIINGVFMQSTFKCAATDDDLMVMERQRQVKVMSSKMEKLFKESDTSGDGNLSIEEFRGVVEDPRIKSWLSAMELDVRDPALFFDLIDKTGDNDREISGRELAMGVSRLKGAARSIDMHLLIRVVENMNALMIQRREEIDEGPKDGGGGLSSKHASISQQNHETLNSVSQEVQALRASLAGLEALMAEAVGVGQPHGRMTRGRSPGGADARSQSASHEATGLLANGSTDRAARARSADASHHAPPYLGDGEANGNGDASGVWVKSWMEAAKSSRVVATGRTMERSSSREDQNSLSMPRQTSDSARNPGPTTSRPRHARAAPQSFQRSERNEPDERLGGTRRSAR